MRTNTIKSLGICLGVTLALCLTQGLSAQCTTTATMLSTQNAVIAFAQTNSNCDTLDINLTITGNVITDLSPLSFLKALRGKLNISNTALTSLEGLHNIDTIGALEISNNAALPNLHGLNNLRAIGGEMRIAANSSLENFVGLDKLASIKGNFIITQNATLIDFTGLENLYGFTDFEVSQNASLINLKGLSNCQNIARLRITNNPKISSLNGLDRLENIWNGLWVKNCNQLQSLGEFPALQRITGTGFAVDSNQFVVSLGNFPGLDTIQNNFSVNANPRLTDLGNMPNLKRISGELLISQNDTLDKVVGWPQLSSVGGNIQISSNKNLQEVSGFSLLYKTGGLHIGNNLNLKYILDFNYLDEQSGLEGINIGSNKNLITINGFQSLRLINNISISYNDTLTEIHGFNLVQDIQRSFSISSNKNLQIIQAFPLLKTSGDFRINANPKLKRIEGLTLLEEIKITPATISSYSGALEIINNPELEYLTDFSSLKSVYKGITLSSNKLSQCNPNFANLNSAVGLTISNNSEMTQISGGQNFNSSVVINNNAKLQSIKQLNASGSISVSNNAELSLIDAFHTGTEIQTITVNNNPKLVTFSGFTNLSHTDKVEFQNLPLLAQIPNLNDSSIIQITIRGCHAIQNLDCFSQLRSTRFFTVDSCFTLHNISGLGNLRTNYISPYAHPVPFFNISRCGLMTFEGLNSLELAENLTISGHPHLSSIGPFPKLKRFYNATRITNNPQLIQIHGLDSLPVVEFSLELTNNPQLQNLECIKKVKQIWGNLKIDNTGIADFSALDSLDYIGTILLKGNLNLTSLAGLEKLQLTKSLKIEENENLTDISAPQYLRVNGPVSITKNTKLQNCAVFPVCERIATKLSDVFIADNGIDCSDVASVAFQCDNTLNVSSGQVYLDENCNGFLDSLQDILMPNRVIIDNATLIPIALTQSNGRFNVISQPSQTLTFRPKLDAAYYVSHPAVHSISATTAPNLTTNLDFSVCLDSVYHDLEVFATTIGALRPGFNYGIRVCIVNKGPWPEQNVSLTLDLDNTNFPFITILDPAGAQLNQDILTWDIVQLDAFETMCFTVTFQLSPSISIGQPLLASITSSYDNSLVDQTISNNTVRWQSQVVGSYDPNIKIVDRKTLPYQGQQQESILDYIIYFQNTGNAPATFIEVFDTVSLKHDLRTFEMVDASHNYTVSFPSDNVIKWRFDDINLPDSTTSPLGSIGFVRFRVATHDGLPLYDEVKNAVAIYFDFNDPIFTDTALTIVCPRMQLQTLAYHAKCDKNNGIAIAQTYPGNFSFLWSTGSTANKISALAPGLYTVTVFSDIAACTEVAVIEIKETPAPQLKVTDLQHVKCFGEANGTITVGSATGLMPFKYVWNTGDTSAQIGSLAPGIYNVILKDKNNCYDTLSPLEIMQPAMLQISGQVNAQTQASPDGSIMVTPVGGTPSYSYAWSNGANSNLITSLASGFYWITVSDTHDCIATEQFEVQYSVGIDDTQTLPLQIHPNPTNAWLQVQVPNNLICNQKLQIKIIDQNGKICRTLQLLDQNSTNISVSDLAAGAYRIVLECSDQLKRFETQLVINR